MKKNKTSFLWFAAGIAALLALWQIASMVCGSRLLLPSPLESAGELLRLVCTRRFLWSFASSSLRVLLGMLCSVPLGIVLGAAAALDKRLGALLKPLFQVVSATPVMSVILIAFLWFGQERTPVFTAFLMIFPLIAANTIAGINAVDPQLKELAAVYRFSRKERFFSMYLPAIAPFVAGGLRGGLSLCWKVVVAAEVLVQPRFSIGAGMQNAKAQFETPELFAWTAGTVIAAALSQALITGIETAVGKSRERSRRNCAARLLPTAALPAASPPSAAAQIEPAVSPPVAGRIAISSIDFSFAANRLIFSGFSLESGGESPVVFLGPSGCGKTTLLRLVAGLLKPRSGTVAPNAASMVFQEPRLLPWKTALENVSLPLRGRMGKTAADDRARHFLRLVSLEGKAASLPAELSGGERQRVNLARAFAVPAEVLLMDEPFQSLDIPLRLELMDLTLTLLAQNPRLALMVSHDPREAVYAGKRVIVLGEAPQGIVHDELVNLGVEERAYGSAAQAAMEKKLIALLGSGAGR